MRCPISRHASPPPCARTEVPIGSGLNAERVARQAEGFPYCLSYTAVLLTFLPDASVPDTVTVRLLPSAATTILPLIVTLPPLLFANVVVCSLT